MLTPQQFLLPHAYRKDHPLDDHCDLLSNRLSGRRPHELACRLRLIALELGLPDLPSQSFAVRCCLISQGVLYGIEHILYFKGDNLKKIGRFFDNQYNQLKVKE